MMVFDRAKPYMSRSLAYRQFRHDMTELNDFYWSGRAAHSFFLADMRAYARTSSPVASYRLAGTEYERRVPATITEFSANVKQNARWQRLTTVMLITSALDRYLDKVAETAIASDPTLSPGFPKIVDGLTLRAHKVPSFAPSILGLTKGTWPRRVAEFRRLFGSVPAELMSAQGELDKVRKLRNRVAHDFAYGSGEVHSLAQLAETSRRTGLLPLAQESISDKGLQRHLGLVDDIAAAIDEHLVSNFIGNYEIAGLFIEWQSGGDRLEKRLGISTKGLAAKGEGARFKSFVGRLLDWQLSLQDANDLRTMVQGL